MSTYPKKTFQSSSVKTSTANKPAGKTEGGNPETKTTHYAKDTNKQFVNAMQIWENEGQFGKYLKIRITEALAPGDYYVTARRAQEDTEAA